MNACMRRLRLSVWPLHARVDRVGRVACRAVRGWGWPVLALVLALVLGPTLGQVHRVLHGAAQPAAQPAAHAPHNDRERAGFLFDLFAGHTPSDCQLLDQLMLGDAAHSIAPVLAHAPPAVLPRPAAAPVRAAPRTAAFHARAPPAPAAA